MNYRFTEKAALSRRFFLLRTRSVPSKKNLLRLLVDVHDRMQQFDGFLLGPLEGVAAHVPTAG
jgi:hypothetical protein